MGVLAVLDRRDLCWRTLLRAVSGGTNDPQNKRFVSGIVNHKADTLVQGGTRMSDRFWAALICAGEHYCELSEAELMIPGTSDLCQGSSTTRPTHWDKDGHGCPGGSGQP